jgi:hypothetical protein
MRNIFKLILQLILILFVVSCGGMGRKARQQATGDTRTSSEAKFDPLGFRGDHDIITGDVSPAADSDAVDDVLPTLKQSPWVRQENQYFSVQLFASKSNSEAKEYKNSIEQIFDEEIRIEYQAPYYRVVVGKCAGFESGDALLKKVNALGFPKAWLVREKKK